MLKRLATALVLVGLAVVVVALAIPVSGTPSGSNTDLSCGPALGAALGTGSNTVVMTGSDVGITEHAWCQGEAGDLLRPAMILSATLIVAGAAVYVVARANRFSAAMTPTS